MINFTTIIIIKRCSSNHWWYTLFVSDQRMLRGHVNVPSVCDYYSMKWCCGNLCTHSVI